MPTRSRARRSTGSCSSETAGSRAATGPRSRCSANGRTRIPAAPRWSFSATISTRPAWRSGAGASARRGDPLAADPRVARARALHSGQPRLGRFAVPAHRARRARQRTEVHRIARAAFDPKNGCPGPVAVRLLPPSKTLSGGLTLIALDLNWWLLPESARPPCDGIATPTTSSRACAGSCTGRRPEKRRGRRAPSDPLRRPARRPHARILDRPRRLDLYRLYGMQDLIEPTYEEMVAGARQGARGGSAARDGRWPRPQPPDSRGRTRGAPRGR